ncbi:hypothetical protein HGG71_05805 [Rhodobacteraceae bacterium R_SAG2]|nr:hypothetical protein [Rhodobacteraceae bacterium R_SAG2]
MNWQPKDTAPRDEPLLCALKYGVGVVIAHTEDGSTFTGDGGHDWTGKVEYWMPLPEAPEAA